MTCSSITATTTEESRRRNDCASLTGTHRPYTTGGTTGSTVLSFPCRDVSLCKDVPERTKKTFFVVGPGTDRTAVLYVVWRLAL